MRLNQTDTRSCCGSRGGDESPPFVPTLKVGRMRGKCSRAIIGSVFLFLLAAMVPADGGAQVGAGPVTYAYDPLGRLFAVVDGSGNAAQYVYDPVGNLTKIVPTTASTVSIFTFSPNNGPHGQSVTIYGDGFSTTLSHDTVTFYNGQNATPTQATIATLVVTVPPDAATGPITVAVSGVGSSPPSTQNFTVTTN